MASGSVEITFVIFVIQLFYTATQNDFHAKYFLLFNRNYSMPNYRIMVLLEIYLFLVIIPVDGWFKYQRKTLNYCAYLHHIGWKHFVRKILSFHSLTSNKNKRPPKKLLSGKIIRLRNYPWKHNLGCGYHKINVMHWW